MSSNETTMDKIVALCKRRGFIFPSSEIYGGINGFWDYGPLGVELKRNIKDAWWHDMVTNPPAGPDGREIEMVGVDCTIIMNPKVWEASGHASGFADPMQMCRACKRLFRADQVWDMLKDCEWVASLATAMAPGRTPDEITVQGAALSEWARTKGKRLAPGLALVRNPSVTLSWIAERVERGEKLSLVDILSHLATEQYARTGPQTPCPNCGGDLTDPRMFNLMFESHTGAVQDESSKVYLRPETAQGIFANFKNVVDTSRVKVPFGIAQIGKAFRNEINPRNYTFRSREFEQMEIEFFCREEDSMAWYDFWRKVRYDWCVNLGLRSEKLRLRDQTAEELAHYSRACADIEYLFPFSDDFQELEGVAHRGNFDLTQHATFSGKDLTYFDDQTKQRYLPHVIEPSAGVDRFALAVLCEAYHEQEIVGAKGTPDTRVFMRFHPRLAPVKAAVFPLVKKDGMPETARAIYDDVRRWFPVFYDEKGAIGRRYARQDEAGTPFCFTIDGQTAEDGTVTVRWRDTLQQERIHKSRCLEYLRNKLAVGGMS